MDDNLERLFINSKHVFIFAFIHPFVSQFDVHCLFYFACAHARLLPFMCNKYTESWWQHTKIIYVDFFPNSHICMLQRQQVSLNTPIIINVTIQVHHFTNPEVVKLWTREKNPFSEECNCLCNGRACFMIFYSHFIFCYIPWNTRRKKAANERERERGLTQYFRDKSG